MKTQRIRFTRLRKAASEHKTRNEKGDHMTDTTEIDRMLDY